MENINVRWHIGWLCMSIIAVVDIAIVVVLVDTGVLW